jgi:MFS family permease
VISGTCVAAHDSAATWMMSKLIESPFLISLMAPLASLPFFLFTVPAGALADRVDRQKLVCVINSVLAVTAIALALLGWLHLLNPYFILGSVFIIGAGFAFNAPAWTAMVPQIVSDSELPSAATLSGLQFNISGIVGPALASLLVPLAGADFVFALNGSCLFLVALAARQRKQFAAPAKSQSEGIPESFGTIFSYFRSAARFQAVLVRNFLFALFISVIPALMPVVGLNVLHLSASNLGLLFTSMGAGSVIGAVFIVPWLRARLSSDYVTLAANYLIIIAYVLMALVRQTETLFVIAGLCGAGWTISASELWVAAQRAMPGWARGRMNAAVIMVSQGGMVLGGLVWGSASSIAGVNFTLLGAAILFLMSSVLFGRVPTNGAGSQEQSVVLSIRVEGTEVTSETLAGDLSSV